jgi:hypothetical protein
MRTASAGEQLFARFAFAPNELGYCGPAAAATMFDLAVTGRTDADVHALARRFSGAWPYLALLAELAGINDPLGERVVRAYWTGGPLLDEIDQHAFGARLVDYIGSQAGHYWKHVTPELLPEAAATHGFHVFGVYPWSRLLGAPGAAQALQVLDSCRIRWGEVRAVEGEHVIVRSQRLTQKGMTLSLAPVGTERVRTSIDGRGFVRAPVPGEWLALHWDWVCDRLTGPELADLQRWTDWQLRATNERLERGIDPPH